MGADGGGIDFARWAKKIAAIPAMLTFGTATVVTQKILFAMKGHGKHKNDKFNRPWFQTNSMFIGMFLCLVVYEFFHFVRVVRKLCMKQVVSRIMDSSKQRTVGGAEGLGFGDEAGEGADGETDGVVGGGDAAGDPYGMPIRGLVDGDEAGEEALLMGDGEAGGSIQRDDAPAVKEKKAARWKTYVYVWVPAMCDLVATAMMNIGLLWIPPSVWQMLRGSMVVFSALLSIVFLKRKLYLYNWVAIFLCISALVIVGLACLNMPTPKGQSPEHSGGSYVLEGIVLVVVAQVVQSSQIVIEEFLLKSVKAPPLFIVGLEGLWGMIFCIAVCLPIVGYIKWEGIHEDSIDTLILFFRTPAILCTGIFYMFAIFVYNFAGMMVTSLFTAVHRTILEAVRTACIWIVNLFIYYVITHNFGEAWTSWSWLELFGFAILTLGMLVYNRVVMIPGLYYPPQEDFSKLPPRSVKKPAATDVDAPEEP